jgi:hypothetical protein
MPELKKASLHRPTPLTGGSRNEGGEGFAPLFVAEALPVAALTLSLGQFIPFFEVECHG